MNGCPYCHADIFEQNVIDEDPDLNAVEYECIACGCEYWIETIENIVIEKEGCLEEEEE